MTYKWSLLIDTDVRAVCQDAKQVRHSLVISDHPTSEDEAKQQAKTLVKMRALKDVISDDLNHVDAANYAMNNEDWLDNQLLNAARKRWGSARYLAEQWLVAGSMLCGLNWRGHITQWLNTDQELSVQLKETLEKPNGIYRLLNRLSLETSNEQYVVHMVWNGEWQTLNGVMLQKFTDGLTSAAILLSNSGQWYTLILHQYDDEYVQIIETSGPPQPEEIQAALPSASSALITQITTLL